MKQEQDFRDNTNKWIEGTLAQTISKKLADKHEKNKDFIFLFRLLTIKYRVKYPLQGNAMKIDLDLDVVLEHKICSAIRRILSIDM
jgi:hypothetical protein